MKWEKDESGKLIAKKGRYQCELMKYHAGKGYFLEIYEGDDLIIDFMARSIKKSKVFFESFLDTKLGV
jgi:hypothetical protein